MNATIHRAIVLHTVYSIVLLCYRILLVDTCSKNSEQPRGGYCTQTSLARTSKADRDFESASRYPRTACLRCGILCLQLLSQDVLVETVRTARAAPGGLPAVARQRHCSMKLATTVACTVLVLAPGAVAQLSNIQHVSAVATQMSTSKSGYETFQVGVQFDSGLVEDVYALFGEAGASMVIPPAFQVAAPFGADVGPVRNQHATAHHRQFADVFCCLHRPIPHFSQ